MVFFAVLLALLGLPVAAALAQSSNQTAHSFETTVEKKVGVRYLLHLPEGYDPKGGKEWPLIFFLHGAGERGDDLDKVTVHGPPMLAKKDPSFPFVVLSPQCPSGEWWKTDELLALLDHVLAKHRIDRKRVYLTGLSMGGYGSWALGARHPERFAAIAPICGGGNTIGIRLARRVDGHPLKSLPVWAFHGARDTAVPLEESVRLIDTLKAIGNQNARLTVYPEAGHNSWTQAYDDPKLYEWFLSHVRE